MSVSVLINARRTIGAILVTAAAVLVVVGCVVLIHGISATPDPRNAATVGP